MDVPLALAIAVGLWALWRVAEGDAPALALVAGVAGAAAALLKGPVGPLLMAVPAPVYLARRGTPRSRLPWLIAGGGAGAPARRALVPGHGAAARRGVHRPFLRDGERGEVPLPLDPGGRAGLPARASGAPPALDAAGPSARPRRGAGLAVGAGAARPLQPAGAEAPALRRSCARPAGPAGEHAARARTPAGPAPRCFSGLPWPEGWRCASRSRRRSDSGSAAWCCSSRWPAWRSAAARVLAGAIGLAGAAVLLFASVLPGATAAADSALGGQRAPPDARCSPPRRIPGSTRSCSARRCTERPARTGSSGRSRRDRPCS